jgi:hypothetical protein
MTDDEVGKLGDLADYTFPQLTEMVEKRKAPAPREQTRFSQRHIIIPVRKVDEINRYLEKGYLIKRELSNKGVVVEVPTRP